MKTKQQKREEAYNRLKSAKWENSKARRKATKTHADWEKSREEDLRHLTLKLKEKVQ
jgi:hypothetical protein